MYKQVVIGVLCVLLAVMTAIAAHQHLALRRMALHLEAAETRNGLPVPDSPPNKSAGGDGANQSHANAEQTNSGIDNATESDGEVPANLAGGTAPDAESKAVISETAAQKNGKKKKRDIASATASPVGANAAKVSAGSGEEQDRSSKEGKKKRRETTEQGAAQSKALLAQAQKSIQDGEYEAARELLQKSLEEDAGNSKAWKQLAQLHHQLGAANDEIDAYQQWMDTIPEDTEPYYMMADAYMRAGLDDEARQYLAAYESMAQGTTGDYVRMSHLYRSMNDREDEGRILSQWAETAPESMDARNAWADYQRRMGNYGEALAQYEAMAAITPDNPLPYRQMAEIYRRNGDYVQAQQQYETALAVRPGDISTMNRLADVRYAAGDLNGALNIYTEIINLEPGSHAAEQAERHAVQIEQQLQPPQ